MTGKTSDKGSANRSNTGGGGDGSDQSSTRSGSTADGKSKDGTGDDQAGAAGGKDGGKGGASGNIAGGEEAGGSGASALDTDPAGSSADDGGSSPLVPILIALAVLAAISVGVVAMRKKREDADPGAPPSPEAG
ncbi:MAG TPA: hypothetical protein VFY04_00155 [Solirubrobacterales bacterium]|nr:hypothetical protein [Solirubrobacterales bacterium]